MSGSRFWNPHDISRRRFIARTGTVSLATIAGGTGALAAHAQATPEATPSASPSPEASPVAYSGPVGVLSPSRESELARLHEHVTFEDAGAEGGTFIYAQTSDLTTVNPLLVSDTYSGLVTSLTHDSLVGISPIDGAWGPSLADSWEIAEDGRTYTFHLNPSVTWHDDTPFTADDVVFSFDATVAEDSLSVRRADVLSVLESYAKIDDHTVQFVSIAPVATFVDKTVGQVGIVAKHIWEDVPFADWGSDPGSTGTDPQRVIGTGPFTFVEWVQGDHATFAKNPSYWNAVNAPYHLDEFIYQIKPDQTVAVQALKTGEVDVADVPFAQAATLKESSPDLAVTDYDTFAFNYYRLNLDPAKSDLFTDVRVRQALLYALDRDLIAETAYQGFAVRADGTQPVLSRAYQPDQINTIYTYDPDKAKQLLADAGWEDSDGDGVVEKDGKKFSFEIEYSEGSAVYEQQIPYQQQAWKDVGIEAIPVAVPFPTLTEHGDNRSFQAQVLGFGWSIDPDQSSFFGGDALPPNGFNASGYKSEAYDEITPRANRELDDEKRLALLVEQTNIVNDDAAVGVVVFRKSIAGASPRVHNFFPNGFGTFWALPWVWLDPA